MGFLDNVRGALREVVSTRSSKQSPAPRDSSSPTRESPAGDEALVESPRQRFETYTIAVGDTLDEISARSGNPLEDLVRINDIADRDLIFPGQVIRIPVD